MKAFFLLKMSLSNCRYLILNFSTYNILYFSALKIINY